MDILPKLTTIALIQARSEGRDKKSTYKELEMVHSENRIACIDEYSRLIDHLPRAPDSELSLHGLCVIGKRVVSMDCERRAHWRKRVASVATQETSSLAVVRLSPEPMVVGLERCVQSGNVFIHTRSDGVCSHSEFEIACDILGVTPSERRVMSYLASGDSLKRIALKTGTELSTVRTHIKNLSRKTGSNGISSLIIFFATLPRLSFEVNLNMNRYA